MKLSQYRHHVLALGFVLALAAPGAIQTVVDVCEGRVRFAGVLKGGFTGASFRAVEDSLEADSWFAKLGGAAVREGAFCLVGDFGHEAVAGREGWLFYRPGVRYVTEGRLSGAELADCAAAVCDFKEQLAGRGIHLIVVPAPCKASIYPDKLAARAGARKVQSPTVELIRRLDAAGVDVVDLFDAFGRAREECEDEALYLARDTHWSPRGAELAGRIAAERVLASGRIAAGETEYELRAVIAERTGDIIEMSGARGAARRYGREMVCCMQVRESRSGALYRDDAGAEVLVLGDSFARIYESDEPGSAGFVSHLARGLGGPAFSLVNEGGASTLVRQTLARRPEMLEGKKVVVWEFAERDVRFGAEGWQLVDIGGR